ncbi:MAG: hypothetical protein AABZ74_05175 [Cyanobacteriota bacterium]
MIKLFLSLTIFLCLSGFSKNMIIDNYSSLVDYLYTLRNDNNLTIANIDLADFLIKKIKRVSEKEKARIYLKEYVSKYATFEIKKKYGLGSDIKLINLVIKNDDYEKIKKIFGISSTLNVNEFNALSDQNQGLILDNIDSSLAYYKEITENSNAGNSKEKVISKELEYFLNFLE